MPRYDMIVIGSGPAGLHASIQAAKLGKSVAVVERGNFIGGVSVNSGTIPSKAIREAVLYLTGIRERGFYGSSYTVKSDITAEDITSRVAHVVRAEREVVRGHFKRNRVEIFRGAARFVDPHRIAIDTPRGQTDEYEADCFVVCVGTRPAHSEKFPIDGQDIFDAKTILELKEIPRTMTVVGGGVIGAEFACIFAALGVPVRIIEMRPTMLDFVDEEIVQALQYHMRDLEISFLLGEKCESVRVDEERRV
ncbi:FAD-dependent oxidoreductase, partial [Candidatus Sumerlaeota bacterium]|nr:FAD-dependent oxidoreductase [Candidatus Sumerlaeota bacterium]